jgi:asparagine synthase (glutamine-hydrolysing)
MSQFAGQFDPLLGGALESNAEKIAWPFQPEPQAVGVHRDTGLLFAQAQYGHDSAGTLCRSAAGTVIAWDGRLDNGSDFITTHGLAADSSDAMLALTVYDAGGVAALGDLIGDWRAAIWDPTRRVVVLANDYAGVRPVYYRQTGPRLTWASSLRLVLDMTGASNEVDDDFLCEYLSRGGCYARTPYRGVAEVPPGCALVAGRQGCSLKRLWEPNPERKIRLRNEHEYREHFLSHFRDAVRVRLRTQGPVCAELSGGLDSSAIVAMTHKLIAERTVDARRLVTVSYCHEGSNDESFRSLMERTYGLESVHLETERYPLVTSGPSGCVTPQWWEGRHREIARLLEAAGCGVFLTGQTGDLIMGNWVEDCEQVADLIRGGALIRGVRAAFEWGVLLHRPMYSILGDAIWMNLRPSFHPSPTDNPIDTTEDSLLPEARRRARRLAEETGWEPWKRAAPGRRKHFRALTEILRARTLKTPESLQHVLYTHPYTHRPLVEFMMGIPADVVSGPGVPRRLMRGAMQGLLPAQVLSRRSKASFDPVFAASLRPCARELLREPAKLLLGARRIVDTDNLMSRLRRFLNGLECNSSQLRLAILLELWLRNRAGAAFAACTH